MSGAVGEFRCITFFRFLRSRNENDDNFPGMLQGNKNFREINCDYGIIGWRITSYEISLCSANNDKKIF